MHHSQSEKKCILISKPNDSIGFGMNNVKVDCGLLSSSIEHGRVKCSILREQESSSESMNCINAVVKFGYTNSMKGTLITRGKGKETKARRNKKNRIKTRNERKTNISKPYWNSYWCDCIRSALFVSISSFFNLIHFLVTR